MLCVALVAALMTAGVSTASAAPVPATWNQTGITTIQGNLTMFVPGYPAFTWQCAIVWRPHAQAGSQGLGGGGPFDSPCTLGSSTANLRTFATGTAWKDSGTYYLKFQSYIPTNSPFGAFTWNSDLVVFTNGSGSTPSTVTFNNTNVGQGIRATGTLTVRDHYTGGLRTLN
jgi:hypothetical protein